MTKTIKPKNLTEYKIPFVLRDLEMAFNSATRERNSLEKLRYWQIIITTGLISFLIGSENVNPNLAFIILGINLILLYIEVGIMWNIYLIGKKSGNQERLLEEKSKKKFEKNIANWEFGTGISQPYYFKCRKTVFSEIIIKRSTVL